VRNAVAWSTACVRHADEHAQHANFAGPPDGIAETFNLAVAA
jgi:hypothetical protein